MLAWLRLKLHVSSDYEGGGRGEVVGCRKSKLLQPEQKSDCTPASTTTPKQPGAHLHNKTTVPTGYRSNGTFAR